MVLGAPDRTVAVHMQHITVSAPGAWEAERGCGEGCCIARFVGGKDVHCVCVEEVSIIRSGGTAAGDGGTFSVGVYRTVEGQFAD